MEILRLLLFFENVYSSRSQEKRMPQGNWTEKDEATIHAIIVNMINQKSTFKELGEKGELHDSFKIKKFSRICLGLIYRNCHQLVCKLLDWRA